MMDLKELMGKSVKELTEDELELKIASLKKMKVMEEKTFAKTKSTTTRTRKSNQDRQLEDALSKLSPEAKKKLMEELGL